MYPATELTADQRRAIAAAVATVLLLIAGTALLVLLGTVNRLQTAQGELTQRLAALETAQTADETDNTAKNDGSLAVSAEAGLLTADNSAEPVDSGIGSGNIAAPGENSADFVIHLSHSLTDDDSGDTPTIARAYGYDYNPNTEDYRFHRGVDVETELGTAVYTAAAGTVSAAYEEQYWGGVVTVEHGGGWCSVYRCVEPAVSAGDEVQAGDVLGYVILASAEAVQQPHLHIELEFNSASRDPALYW